MSIHPRARALANQIIFRRPRRIIKSWFRKRKHLGPIQSEIWIYPIYPIGWDAELIAGEKVWLMEYRFHNGVRIRDIRAPKGFRKNGTIMYF